MTDQIYSLGHSNLPVERFLSLLKSVEITAVADVRSSPYSKRAPWFTQRDLKQSLKQEKIAYVFLGQELGGRPRTAELFTAGVADYDAMAATSEFRSGISRLIEGARKYKIALVCAEKDPLHCHRCLLVSRALRHNDFDIFHILHDGRLESQSETERRLLMEEGLNENDWIMSEKEQLAEAYRRRNLKVAYSLVPRKSEIA